MTHLHILAQSKQQAEFRGKWDKSVRIRANNNEINFLGLWVVFLALNSFCSDLSNGRVFCTS